MDQTKWCPGFARPRHLTPVAQFYRNVARDDGLSPLCVSCHRGEVESRRCKLRLEAIAVLGGRCQNAICAVPGGMRDPRALQFDHNGNAKTGHRVVRAILDGSTEYQVLCANCSGIKKAELAEMRGTRLYDRMIPTERLQGPGRGNSPGARAALDAVWSDPDKRADAIAKRSASRAQSRSERVAAETGSVDPSWVRRELEGCVDCGTRERPHEALGLCGTCYMRQYARKVRA